MALVVVRSYYFSRTIIRVFRMIFKFVRAPFFRTIILVTGRFSYDRTTLSYESYDRCRTNKSYGAYYFMHIIRTIRTTSIVRFVRTLSYDSYDRCRTIRTIDVVRIVRQRTSMVRRSYVLHSCTIRTSVR